MRVLIVEDEPYMAEAIRDGLGLSRTRWTGSDDHKSPPGKRGPAGRPVFHC